MLALLGGLLKIAPTLGARVSHAAVVGETEGPAAGLVALKSIDDPRLDRFLPYWATQAHLLSGSGCMEEAHEAYSRAIAIAPPGASKAFLEGERARGVGSRSPRNR